MQLFVRVDGRTLVLDASPESSLCDLGLQDRCGLDRQDAYLQLASGPASLEDPSSLAQLGVREEDTLTVCLRLLGGKGGFGALLRGAGRAAATDNTDAYRDLSGRRLRHVHADERLRDWARQSKEMQAQLAELKRLKEEEKASKTAAAAEADKHAVREAQRAAVAGILATMEEHFTRHPKRSASPQPQQPPPKRSKLLDLDLGDVDFGSDASSDDQSDDDYFESLVGGQQAAAGPAQDTARASTGSEESAGEAVAPADLPAPSQPSAAQPAPAAEQPEPAQEAKQPRSAPEPASEAQPPLDVSSYASVAELEAVGADRLKAELQERGLKCGGTAAQRAARLYLLKDTPLDKLDAKHFARK